MDSGARPPVRARLNVVRASAWIATLLLLLAALAPAAVSANDKVFVCKYVGTPGVDERLQTGQNPISVSVNAIPDFEGVGSFFADAQGQSFVLAWDTGQPEPDVSECPAPAQPTPTPTPTPGGGAAAESEGPTLPPTDTSARTGLVAGDPGWQAALAVLAGILAFALVALPRRPVIRSQSELIDRR